MLVIKWPTQTAEPWSHILVKNLILVTLLEGTGIYFINRIPLKSALRRKEIIFRRYQSAIK